MAVVTFMSDYGWEDHYVAAVKAAVLNEAPDATIIDISHHIKPFNIGHGAYVLKNSFRQFPKGSVHIVAIDNSMRKTSRVLMAEIEDHWIISKDTGIFSILSDLPPKRVLEVTSESSTFPARDFMAATAGKYINGLAPDSLGTSVEDEFRLIGRAPKVSKREIVGNIVRVDYYGNLITNIKKSDYDAIQKINGNVPVLIQFGREQFQRFHQDFGDVEPGECYVIFNGQGVLQIGLNLGNASELLGLKEDAPVYIAFHV